MSEKSVLAASSSPPSPKKKIIYEPGVLVKFAAAGFSACAADAVTFPLDVAKVRLQIQGEGLGKLPMIPSTAAARLVATGVAVHPSGAAAAAVVASGSPSGSVLAALSATKSANKALSLKTSVKPKYSGLAGTLRVIFMEEGVKGLYSGLSPGLQRQLCFSSIRIGLYDSVKRIYQTAFTQAIKSIRSPPKKGVKGGAQQQSTVVRVAAGLTTGCLAIACAQPTDVVKVRMQAQTKGGPVRYTRSFQAYQKIIHEEGTRGLWKGSLPNMARNSVVNVCELVTYDMIKEKIISLKLMKDSLPCHFVAGSCAGFITTVVASPIDVVKTRFMNSGRGQYNGVMDCAFKMAREGGLPAFYKGFLPSFSRIATWNILMFISYEQMKKLFHKLSHPEAYRRPVSVIQWRQQQYEEEAAGKVTTAAAASPSSSSSKVTDPSTSRMNKPAPTIASVRDSTAAEMPHDE